MSTQWCNIKRFTSFRNPRDILMNAGGLTGSYDLPVWGPCNCSFDLIKNNFVLKYKLNLKNLQLIQCYIYGSAQC